MLNKLRMELLELVANDRQSDALERLGEVMSLGTPLRELLTTTSSKFVSYELADMGGTESHDNLELQINKIRRAITYICNNLTENDLVVKSKAGDRPQIPAYHRFGVDRIPQEGQFFDEQFDAGDKKVHFYYLQGGVRQKTDSLAERLGFKLVGLQLTADDFSASYEASPPLVINCTPVLKVLSEKHCRASLIHAIVNQFVGGVIPMNQMRGMLDMKLTDLLEEPKMKSADGSYHPIVCINVTISHSYWRKDIIPPMMRQFYDTFCKCDLPEDSPTFYFFFGLEYSAKKPKVKKEVNEAIAARERGSALPELEAVPLADISTWFEHHEVMLPDGYDADQMVAENFPASSTLDMLEVEAGLQRLIDKFNEGLSLKKTQ